MLAKRSDSEKIAGPDKREETAVSGVPAVFFVVADGTAYLAGFEIAAEGRAGGYAGSSVKGYAVFHEDVDNAAGEHAAHGAAFHYEPCFHDPARKLPLKARRRPSRRAPFRRSCRQSAVPARPSRRAREPACSGRNRLSRRRRRWQRV